MEDWNEGFSCDDDGVELLPMLVYRTPTYDPGADWPVFTSPDEAVQKGTWGRSDFAYEQSPRADGSLGGSGSIIDAVFAMVRREPNPVGLRFDVLVKLVGYEETLVLAQAAEEEARFSVEAPIPTEKQLLELLTSDVPEMRELGLLLSAREASDKTRRRRIRQPKP